MGSQVQLLYRAPLSPPPLVRTRHHSTAKLRAIATMIFLHDALGSHGFGVLSCLFLDLGVGRFALVSIHWGSGVGVFPAPDHPMLSFPFLSQRSNSAGFRRFDTARRHPERAVSRVSK